MALNIAVNWDFSNLVLEDFYIPINSYGGGGGGGGGGSATTVVDAIPVSAPAVINTVSIALPPPIPATGDPTPEIQVVKAEQQDSITTYGTQSAPVVMTLLANTVAAETLAAYLGRSQPIYWYSNIRVDIGSLSQANQDLVAELEIGDQIRISKRFKGMASPTVQTLFVEGIEHEITPSGHSVTLFTSSGIFWEGFIIGTSVLDDQSYGLG